MGKYLDSLDEFIKEIEGYKIPAFKELPEIKLYMEQVVAYVSEAIGVFSKNKDVVITPFMVNNYVKARIIEAPVDKKYNRNHLGYLIAISLLKSVVSMKNLATLIDIDRKAAETKIDGKRQMLYEVFKTMEEDAIQSTTHKVKTRIDLFKRASKRPTKKDSTIDEDEVDRRNLAYIALKLYIESETNKIVADAIMNKISLNGEEDLEISKYDRKKSSHEAKKLKKRDEEK